MANWSAAIGIGGSLAAPPTGSLEAVARLQSGRIEARTGLRMMPTVGIEIERTLL
jgi:hypothetical protein